MFGKRRLGQLLCAFALATLLVGLGAGKGEGLTDDAWVGPMTIAPSPKGDRIALTLVPGPHLTSPLLVIDGAGELQISTAQSPRGEHHEHRAERRRALVDNPSLRI